MAKQPRRRRTAEELFLDKLSKLTHGEQTLIPNATLQDALGWDRDKYTRIRLQLRKDQRINVGQGQGGKVGIAKLPNSKALKLFVSYSHVDEIYTKELLKHLDPLKRLKLIDAWHDGKIQAGQELDAQISAEMSSADIILMLVSIDYLNSYYCIEIEMERAMERHDAGTARVIPIILRSCMWQHMPFQKLKALPKDGKAISTWSDRDEAFVSVTEDLHEVAGELLALR
jgi:hypothetical protein